LPLARQRTFLTVIVASVDDAIGGAVVPTLNVVHQRDARGEIEGGTPQPAHVEVGPAMSMDGVIGQVTPFLCDSAQGWGAIIQVTSAPASVNTTGEGGTMVAMIDPVTVIVMPGTSVATPAGTSVSAAMLGVGDLAKLG